MNAITLLSGWSNPREQQQQQQQQHRRTASLSRVQGEQEQHGRGSLEGQERDDHKDVNDVQEEERHHQRYVYGHSPYAPIILSNDGTDHHAAIPPEDARQQQQQQLKPPEAAAYERKEEEHIQQLGADSSSAPSIFDPASLYPTPAPSRSPTPTNSSSVVGEEEHENEVGEATTIILSESGSSSSAANPSSSTRSTLDSAPEDPSSSSSSSMTAQMQAYSWPSAQSHDEVAASSSPPIPQQQQHHRRLSDKQTRALARSFPVRCIARIYMLLRRFFALFGVELDQYPPQAAIAPVPATSDTRQHHHLTAPILAHPSVRSEEKARVEEEDAPPSYDHATQSSFSSSMSTLQTNATAAQELVHKPAAKQPFKSRFGNLLGRGVRSATPSTTTDNNDTTKSDNVNEGYASTSSDDWTLSEEKKLIKKEQRQGGPPDSSLSKIPPRIRSGPTRASIAELALSKPKMLVLDLDETLIHSTSRMSYASGAVTSSVDASSRSAWNANTSGLKVRVVEVVLDGRSVIYHVYKRPWVDFFLRKVSSWYTVVVFTASLQEYADPVIDWLDQGRGMISSRLFRESCTYVNGSYVKDLTIVDKDLARVCLVDNSPISYAINQPNGIPIEGWINDPNDEALLDLLPMLDSLRFTNDVRHILALRLAASSTAQLSAAAKARRRRFTSATMGPDSNEQLAAQRAVAAHQKAE